jgi:hypothetical protein
MSFAEESRKTDESKARALARELFSAEDESPGFIVSMAENANEIPFLKGMYEGIESCLTDQIEAGHIPIDEAAKTLTALDMAKVAIYAYILSEVPDVLPPPADS